MLSTKSIKILLLVMCLAIVVGTTACQGRFGPPAIDSSVRQTVEAYLVAGLVAEKAQQTLTAISQTDDPEQTGLAALAGSESAEATDTAPATAATPTPTSDPEMPAATITPLGPDVTLKPSATYTLTATKTPAHDLATSTALPATFTPTRTHTTTPTKPLVASATVAASATPTRAASTNTAIPPTNTARPPTATSLPATATPLPVGCDWSGNQGLETQLINLINDERSARGLSTLSTHSALVAAARGHSQDMACNNFFSHTGSNGSSPFSRMLAAGYSYSLASENIYAGTGASASSTFQAWLGSSGHRDNMLHPDIVHIGIGYAYTSTSTYGAYVTANFGKP